MLVSFASYQLWLDWRKLTPAMARLFLDYEPGIHYPQFQMQVRLGGADAPLESSKAISSVWKHSGADSSPPRAASTPRLGSCTGTRSTTTPIRQLTRIAWGSTGGQPRTLRGGKTGQPRPEAGDY